MDMKRRRKRRPDNMERCCVGLCSGHTAIIYAKDYPLCLKHYDAHCDEKFKYKHFKDLREYLGIPPIKRPPGYEAYDKDYFAVKMDLLINVSLNVPVIVEEEYVLYGGQQTEEPNYIDSCVKWDGKKELGSRIFIEINKQSIVLMQAKSKGIKFASRSKIELTVSELQDILNNTEPEYVGACIYDAFKKSKLWEVNGLCAKEIGAALDDRAYIQEGGEGQGQELQDQGSGD
jgi:hypothetical protein